MHVDDLTGQLIGLVEIVWINLILSGDNAVVIALACRGLPPALKRRGMIAGAGVAVILRILFTIIVAALLSTPFVKIAGGLLLLWIAAKLLVEEEDSTDAVRASDRLWAAVRTVAIADAVMSLDNVLAIAAVANGSMLLLILGLAISIPLIVAGASLLMRVLDRWPVLVWAGAVLLGWVAGEMLVSDPFLTARIGAARVAELTYPAAAAGAAIVLLAGWGLRRLHAGR